MANLREKVNQEITQLLLEPKRISIITGANQGSSPSTSDGPSNSKRFKTLQVNNTVSRETTRVVEDEAVAYLANEDIQLDEDIDPIEYWKTCNIYPKLANFALDLLMLVFLLHPKLCFHMRAFYRRN